MTQTDQTGMTRTAVSEAWGMALLGYQQWLIAAGRSTGTIGLRTHYVGRLAAAHPDGPGSMTPLSVTAFMARPWKPETRKSALASVRGFCRWAVDYDLLTADPSRKLPKVAVPRATPRPAPDHVVERALAWASPRDALMVQLAQKAGLRRNEIATLDTGDRDGNVLFVTGKGGVRRMVPMHPDLVVAWSEHDPAPGPVFPGRHDGHISADAVGKALKRRLGPGWSGHKLRTRFGTRVYSADRDLLATQQLMGHAKPETTVRYVLVGEDALARAIGAA